MSMVETLRTKFEALAPYMDEKLKRLWAGTEVVNLIGSNTTKTGLRVQAQLDEREYEIGKKVSDEDLSAVNIEPATFHGEWNYSIAPHIT